MQVLVTYYDKYNCFLSRYITLLVLHFKALGTALLTHVFVLLILYLRKVCGYLLQNAIFKRRTAMWRNEMNLLMWIHKMD